MKNNTTPDNNLVADIVALVEQNKQRAATVVNSTITYLYWKIGTRVNQEILSSKRAEYGKNVISTLSKTLKSRFGKGFEEANLRRMLQFSQIFSDEQIVATLLRQLTWSHFTILMPIKDSIQREFYIQMCRSERWSVRKLRSNRDKFAKI